MLKQLFEIAKTVIVASLRKNLILAVYLIMLPLVLAAWLFEVNNIGFQTGFIIDAGHSLFSFLSIILLAVLSFEHLFCPKEQQTPWFYFSRLKYKILFPAGKFIGISLVLLSVLIDFSILLILLLGFTSDAWLIEPIKIAFMVWAEYSLMLAVFAFLLSFLSRLMSVGLIVSVFFVAHSAPFWESILPTWLAEPISIVFPNASVFDLALESGSITNILLALLYSVFMSAFYISLSGFILRNRDL